MSITRRAQTAWSVTAEGGEASTSRVDWFFRELEDIYDVRKVANVIHARGHNIHFVKAEDYVVGDARRMWMHCIVGIPCGKSVEPLADQLKELATINGWRLGGPFDHCTLAEHPRKWSPAQRWTDETLSHPFF